MPEANQTVGVQAETGMTRIDDQEANSIRFTRHTPEAGDPTYTAAFYSGSKVVAKFDKLDADSLADTVGDKNAKAIIQAEGEKGILKGEALHNEYGISPEENQRRSAEKEQRKTRDFIGGIPMESMPGHRMVYNDQPGMAGVEVVTPNLDRISFGGRPAVESFIQENNIPAQEAQVLRVLDAGADRVRSEPAYPEIKTYAAREDGRYSGRIVHIDGTHAVQDLNGKSVIVHDLAKLQGAQHQSALHPLGESLETGKRLTIEYGKENVLIGPEQPREPRREGQGRAADGREPSSEGQAQSRDQQGREKGPEKAGAGEPVANELTALKNAHMGKDAKMYMARENNGFSSYTGTVIAETGSHILQRLNDKTVIVHEKVNVNKDVEVGQNVNLTYSKGRVYVNDPSQDRQQQRGQAQDKSGERAPDQGRADTDPRQSFFQARSIILKEFGQGSKVYDPNLDKGDYKGQVVVITDKHVGQRLGANTFVIHDKGNLSGEYHKGQSVQVKYANQRATAVELTRTQGRDQGQGPSLGVNR